MPENRPIAVMPRPAAAAVEECWATVEGRRIRYRRAGSGPPLLLVHGLLGYSFSWRFNLEELGRRGAVYAPDLLGTGYSERPKTEDHGLDAAARRVLAFAAQLGLENFDLLGTSHGGAVAMRMAEQAAANAGKPRIRSLILVAPVNPWSELTSPFLPLARTRLGRTFMKVLGTRATVLHDAGLRRMYGDRSRIRPGTLEGYSAPLKLPGTLEYVHAILDHWSTDMALLERDLDRIRTLPTLLLWGSRDRVVNPRSAAALCARFDKAELIVLPGVGHLPYEEAPEEFNRIVTAFLAKRP